MGLFKKKSKFRLSEKKKFVFCVENVGDVCFKRSHRAKRLIIRVKEGGDVSVSVPRGIDVERAIDFVVDKEEWINKTLKKLNRIKQKNISNKKKLISQESAGHIIETRVKYLANFYGFKYEKISIKSQKTIWGSCTGKNNLNFNYKIASLPNDLMDYVIFHELTHTIVKNHSLKFWRMLDKYVKDSKALRKKLKYYNF